MDEAQKAQKILHAIGITDVVVESSRRLRLDAHLDRVNEIARALVSGGVELYDLHRQETTLEEYFIKLVGGAQNA